MYNTPFSKQGASFVWEGMVFVWVLCCGGGMWICGVLVCGYDFLCASYRLGTTCCTPYQPTNTLTTHTHTHHTDHTHNTNHTYTTLHPQHVYQCSGDGVHTFCGHPLLYTLNGGVHLLEVHTPQDMCYARIIYDQAHMCPNLTQFCLRGGGGGGGGD